MKIVYFLILTMFTFSSLSAAKNIFDSNRTFKIVFVADPRVVSNKGWLNKITKDWGATGICIRIFWGHIDTDTIPGADNWNNLDKAINTLLSFENKKLDIYLRVCMGLQKPLWVLPDNKRFITDDFQIKYDKSIYDHQAYEKGIPESERYPLNFNSPTSQKYMKDFLNEVLMHIDNSFPDSVKSRIKEIVPTFSTSDEAEYPFSAMCGYSLYENKEFINFLKSKYLNSLSNLNARWNSKNNFKDFETWSEISPERYEWHTYNNSDYKYPNGRVDWINFRTRQLGSFLNSLSDLINLYNFQTGIQLGSIYDDLMERRGWVDPTLLFERANAVHVADIYQYSNNFDFGANYLNSICKFWTQTNKFYCLPVYFSTETNWPNFNNKDGRFLSYFWIKQLISYYNNGAKAHYLVGWDITPEELDRLKLSYESWRKALIYYSDKEIIEKENQICIHLGVEQVFYNHNKKSFWNKTFTINDFVSSQYNVVLDNDIRNSDVDVITNFMLEKNVNYLRNYKSIYFAKENGIVSEKAFLDLKQFLLEAKIIKEELNEHTGNLNLYKNEYSEDYRKLPGKIIFNK